MRCAGLGISTAARLGAALALVGAAASGRCADAPAAGRLAKDQSVVRALFVVMQENGMHLGGAQEIIATARAQEGGGKSVDFAIEVGKEMRTCMDEAESFVKLKHPGWDAGHRVRLSFSNKYTMQEGGSAGTAFTLLLLSLIEGFDIDRDFAVTGDVTVDGRIRKVGGVAEKVRGATLDKCRFVAVPAENKDDMADLVLLYDASFLWRIQAFSIETIDDARALLRTDRAEALAKAIEIFAGVQKTMEDLAGADGSLARSAPSMIDMRLRKPDVSGPLQEVLRLAPNHLSAAFLLAKTQGRLPRTLSLSTSMDELMALAGPFLQARMVRMPNGGRSVFFPPVPEEQSKAALGRLASLRSRVHPRTAELQSTMTTFIQSRGSGDQKRQMESYQQVSGVLGKLGVDRKIAEELMR